MDLAAIARAIRAAAGSEEPDAQQSLSQVRLSSTTLQQGRAILAVRGQVVHVANSFGVQALPCAELTWMTNQAVTALPSTLWMLSRTHIRSATRKRMPTGVSVT